MIIVPDDVIDIINDIISNDDHIIDDDYMERAYIYDDYYDEIDDEQSSEIKIEI